MGHTSPHGLISPTSGRPCLPLNPPLQADELPGVPSPLDHLPSPHQSVPSGGMSLCLSTPSKIFSFSGPTSKPFLEPQPKEKAGQPCPGAPHQTSLTASTPSDLLANAMSAWRTRIVSYLSTSVPSKAADAQEFNKYW